MSLPNTYRQLDFIVSSGTQYINTEQIVSNDSKIDINFSFLNTNESFLFGVKENGSGTRLSFGCWSSKFILYCGDTYTANSSSNTDYNNVVVYGTGQLYVNGVLSGTASTYTNTTANLTLFRQSDTSSLSSSAKIYTCKIYKNNALVRDYIPAERLSDHEIGLYDLQNDVFYTNAGSGSFYGGYENIILEDNPLELVLTDNVELQANFEKHLSKKYIIAS